MHVTYKGQKGIVIEEKVLEGVHFNVWTVTLANGGTVTGPMWQFEIVGESVGTALKSLPLSHWSDIE